MGAWASELYAIVSLVVICAVFIAIYFKMNNFMMAISCSAVVLGIAILIAPYQDYELFTITFLWRGQWAQYTMTAIHLKVFLTFLLLPLLVVTNWLWKKAKVPSMANG